MTWHEWEKSFTYIICIGIFWMTASCLLSYSLLSLKENYLESQWLTESFFYLSAMTKNTWNFYSLVIPPFFFFHWKFSFLNDNLDSTTFKHSRSLWTLKSMHDYWIELPLRFYPPYFQVYPLCNPPKKWFCSSVDHMVTTIC